MSGRCSPKKRYGHAAFKINCKAKMDTAFAFCKSPTHSRSDHRFQLLTFFSKIGFIVFQPFFQTRNKETPIKKYSKVHTGPNASAGGISAGFSSSANQPKIAGIVKTAPITPTNSTTATAIINLKKLFKYFISSFHFVEKSHIYKLMQISFHS